MTWLNWPNRITIARILLVVPLMICLLNMNSEWTAARHVGLVLFVVMAISDGLDGFLARRLKEETPLGRFLDPVADKLLIVTTVVLLAIDGTGVPGFILPSWVPVIIVGKDVLVVLGFVLVYLSCGQVLIEPRILGKACTLVQLVTVAVILLAPDLPLVLQGVVPALWWVAAGVAILAGLDYLRAGNRFVADYHATSRKHEGGFDE